MDGLDWLIIITCVLIYILLSICINNIAKKQGCYEYMKNIKHRESRMTGRFICLILAFIIFTILKYFNIFESERIRTIYFSLLIPIVFISSKLSKFIIARDMKKRNNI